MSDDVYSPATGNVANPPSSYGESDNIQIEGQNVPAASGGVIPTRTTEPGVDYTMPSGPVGAGEGKQ